MCYDLGMENTTPPLAGMPATTDSSKVGMIGLAIAMLVIGLVAGYVLGKSGSNQTPVLTFTGTSLCLPHRGVKPGDPQTMECMTGFRTDSGIYYAIRYDPRKIRRSGSDGGRIKITGKLTPYLDEKYISEGIIDVETIEGI